MRRGVMVLMLLWPFAAGAAVYKWVDADGKVHFGDGAPNGQSAQEVPIKEEPATRDPEAEDHLKKLRRFSDAYEQEQREKAAAERKAAEESVKRKRDCAEARERVTRYQRARFLYDRDKKGEKVIISDEQRARAEKSAEEEARRLCGPGR